VQTLPQKVGKKQYESVYTHTAFLKIFSVKIRNFHESNIKFRLYCLKVAANSKFVMQCFENFGVANVPPPGCATAWNNYNSN